jgi:hypothetical protein
MRCRTSENTYAGYQSPMAHPRGAGGIEAASFNGASPFFLGGNTRPVAGSVQTHLEAQIHRRRRQMSSQQVRRGSGHNFRIFGMSAKCLIYLVGALGLEPRTR